MQTVNRRRFIQNITLAGAGAALSLHGSGFAASDLPIGIQLYTVRGLSRDDFQGTLAKVAKIGYKNFEFAGYGDLAAEGVNSLMANLGTQACGTHEGFQKFEADAAAVVSFNRAIKTPYVVVPSMPREARSGGVAEIEQFAAGLNKYGEMVKQAGMQLCYHNHSFEFEKAADGRTIWEVLMEASDPNLVKAEVDIAWVYNADVDPVELLGKYGDRVKLLHMKDLDKDRNLTPVGEGEIDLKAVVAKAKQIGVEWYIVEQDRTREGKEILDEVAISFKNLTSLLS
ncbi:MAG: sugar phosphate isomerase/epimerase [Acidobacteriota bacterium]|nr:MAG: sugar phosphate isomerase/epimerase [Acidobacteriota bacterium]